MSDDNGGTLRAVSWSEKCPWLCILRTFRLAISFRVLTLAAVAIFLTLCGWSFFGWAFSGDSGPNPDAARQTAWSWPSAEYPWATIDKAIPNRTPLANLDDLGHVGRPDTGNWPQWPPFVGTWAELGRPLWSVFDPRVNVSRLACLVLCGLWSLAIWAFFGGAISRMAAVQLTCDERVGWAAALRFACTRWRAYFAAPLFPLIGIAFAAVPAWVLGWFLRVDLLILVAAVLWPLLLLLGLLIAVLLLGLVFGWPLMWGAISTEGTDSFGALQRCYAYVFGRPLQYLFYATVATVLGLLGWALVQGFAATVVDMAYWPAGWSAGSISDGEEPGTPRINLITGGSNAMADAPVSVALPSLNDDPSKASEPTADDDSTTAPEGAGEESFGAIGRAGVWLIHLWAGCVKLLAVGFLYGYFWTAATAIYLLLRRDEDATEMDEVFLDEDASEPTYGLPPLGSDEAGAPVVTDDVPEIEPDQTEEPDAQPPEIEPREEE